MLGLERSPSFVGGEVTEKEVGTTANKKGIVTTPGGEYWSLYADLLKQPHLLIAGATGSGKSVVVNGLISTALHHPPGRLIGGVEFILIDPKRVELAQYRQLRHTLLYASEPQDFLFVLDEAMRITEDRYRTMQAQGIRRWTGGDLYIIIDEFADLMTTQRRAVQPVIQRLAQIGRAAKVHLIIATQTPISKVLPTEIKCNFDARVGLRTRSRQDSINILGHAGLETLPRYGEGVVMLPEGETLYKIPMVDDAEIERLCSWWMEQCPPQPPRKPSLLQRLFGW